MLLAAGYAAGRTNDVKIRHKNATKEQGQAHILSCTAYTALLLYEARSRPVLSKFATEIIGFMAPSIRMLKRNFTASSYEVYYAIPRKWR